MPVWTTAARENSTAPTPAAPIAISSSNRYQDVQDFTHSFEGESTSRHMTHRFCPNCGAKLWRDANFCAECGERVQTGGRRDWRPSWAVDRYAPLIIVLSVVGIGSAAVVSGVLAPKPRPSIPDRGMPEASTGSSGPSSSGSSQEMPPGHPPIEIPQQVRDAIRDLRAKAEAAPDDLATWKHLAEVQYRAGQLDPSFLADAAAAYRHVLEREPDNLDAMRNLGNVAFDQNQPDIAAGYYQQYLKIKPDDLNVRTDLGTMYLSGGKTDEAIREYDAVMQADPKFFQAQFNLAIAYRTLGDEQKMQAALEKASTLATDDRSRDQVNQLQARLKGVPPPPPMGGSDAVAGAPAQVAAPGGAAGTFHTDAEAIFRQNPILGPKVGRIEWQGPDSARVYVHDFPMDQMGDAMRSMFVDRMRGRIKEKKQTYNLTETARFEVIDEPSGRVMETITE
jgi:tetratricopeptide (TPR) repeat protein